MEHDDPKDDLTKSPQDDKNTNEDLYCKDLPSSLANRFNTLDLNNQAAVSANIASPSAKTHRNESLGLQTRPISPPFKRPAAWKVIDHKHNKRVANERAAETQMSTEQELRRLRESLRYRSEVIDRAIESTNDDAYGCIILKPWGMAGLRHDLLRHPYQLEEYIHQEMEIGTLLMKRMKWLRLLVLHGEIPNLSGELRYLEKAIVSHKDTLNIDKTKLFIRDMLNTTWEIYG